MSNMASSTPMLRSYSSDSQKRDWGKRLSLRGIKKSREVRMFFRLIL